MGKILTRLRNPYVSRSSCACTDRRGVTLLEGSPPKQSSQHGLVGQKLCTALQAASSEEFFLLECCVLECCVGKSLKTRDRRVSLVLVTPLSGSRGTSGPHRRCFPATVTKAHEWVGRITGLSWYCWVEGAGKFFIPERIFCKTGRSDLTSELAARVFQPTGRLRVSQSPVLGLRDGLAGAVPRAQD